MQKQRLLYLHARSPSVFSNIIGFTPIEPTEGYQAQIRLMWKTGPMNPSIRRSLTGGGLFSFPICRPHLMIAISMWWAMNS